MPGSNEQHRKETLEAEEALKKYNGYKLATVANPTNDECFFCTKKITLPKVCFTCSMAHLQFNKLKFSKRKNKR